MTKRWQIKKPAPKKFIEGFPEYHPIILQLLYNRGIRKEQEIERFLNPDWERDLYDPFLMKGMKEAVKRIKEALFNKEKVAVFGHFDVDGVVSATILYLIFKKLGLWTDVYIPDRKESYGLSEEGVQEFKKNKVGLIVSVDTGISSLKEIELARKLKMEVVILDHHEVPKNLPKAKAILNPKQKNCAYPFKDLASAGVVFKLAQALASDQQLAISNQELKWLADLVGLGTICDVVPLISENRLFAKFGLIVLNKTKRLGLLKLYDKAQIELGKIDPYTVSFIIGPRLNAPGRMDHANASFYLLTTKSPEKAKTLAITLDDFNRERQRILEKAYQEARTEVKERGLLEQKLILVGKREWPSGIIGLIASKLVNQYGRPALVLQLGKELSKGSARSIEALHMTETLSECEEYLIKFGGHKKAAGFSVYTSKIEELKKRMTDLAEERLTEEDITPTLEIEAEVPLSSINWGLWQELEKLEPTGFGNPRPVFLAKKVKIEDVRTVGKQDQHLKMTLWGFDSIFFEGNKGDLNLKPSDMVEVVFQIGVDEWRSERRLQLKILDLKRAEEK